jgi:hypothetical protein
MHARNISYHLRLTGILQVAAQEDFQVCKPGMSTLGHSDFSVGTDGTCTQIGDHHIDIIMFTNNALMIKKSTLSGEMWKTVHVI